MRDVVATDGDTLAGRAPGLSLADTGVALAVGLLSALLLVPAEGVMPGISLDLSWFYTLADAAGRHLPFGRDMVFTFGPLSSVYTRFFLPDQRAAATALKLVLVVAFCLATVAMSRRPLRWAALALPLLIANLYLVDSLFLAMPWVLVALATAPRRNGRLWAAGLLGLAAVFGPLLLVKGTLAVPLAASVAAAAVATASAPDPWPWPCPARPSPRPSPPGSPSASGCSTSPTTSGAGPTWPVATPTPCRCSAIRARSGSISRAPRR